MSGGNLRLGTQPMPRSYRLTAWRHPSRRAAQNPDPQAHKEGDSSQHQEREGSFPQRGSADIALSQDVSHFTLLLTNHRGLVSQPIKPSFLPQQKGRDLLTPQLRHWYAFNGTLSGTPEWACLESCPLNEITSFELDSSRSRKAVVVLVYIVFFPNVRNCITNREFPQELFWMTLRNHGNQSNLWPHTGQPEITPSVAFRVKPHVSLFCDCSRPLAASLCFPTSAPGASSPLAGQAHCARRLDTSHPPQPATQSPHAAHCWRFHRSMKYPGKQVVAVPITARAGNPMTRPALRGEMPFE